MGRNCIDLTGQVFGRLTVLGRSPEHDKYRHAMWLCQCSCSDHTIISVPALSLKTGNTKSCGCLHRETMHELSKWKSDEDREIMKRFDHMKQRCYNQKSPRWNNYGGRGIYICEEWLRDPSKFVMWAKAHDFRRTSTIDRVNNSGPYAPWNCRWVDRKTQSNNTSSNVLISVNGVSHNLKQWSDILGVSYDTIEWMHRIKGDNVLISFIADRLNQV